jgi:outer membrane protein
VYLVFICHLLRIGLFAPFRELFMTMRLPFFLGSLMALGVLGITPHHPASAQSLEDAMAAAYAGNPTLLAKRAELRATDEGVPQALSGWRPSISAKGSTGVSSVYLNTRTTNKTQHPNPTATSLTLSQSLYSGGQTLAAIGSAENSVLAGRAELAGVEQTVLLDAVNAYVNVFREQAVLELRINNEQVLKRQLEATTDRFQVGEITRTDVHQAEARLAKATADRIQAEGNLVSARASYRNVIGEAPGQLIRPKINLNLPTSAGESIKLAVAQNPSVVNAEYKERASQDDIQGVRGELLPSVDLSGTASRSLNSSSEGTRTDNYTAKVTLSVPLYQSGSVYSRLRSARQTASQKRRQIDAARRSATETAARAWETLQTSRARIQSFEAQIKASEVALEGVQREASVGSRTVLDVLDAEQELLDAKVSIVSAQRDEAVAVFELKSAIGELTASHLALPVEAYDSAKNYNQVRPKLFGGKIENVE